MRSEQEKKPHAVCIPTPLQGHINPMLKDAKLLHANGFLITFVNNDFNHQRLVRSQGPDTLSSFPSFRFVAIPDGLPPPDNNDVSQDVPIVLKSLDETGYTPFKSLVSKINASDTLVTCIVADFLMGFTLPVAEELGIPGVLLWTSGSGSLILYDQYPNLIEKGLMPLKDPSYLVNGYMDTIVDFIPTMPGIHLKDIPPFVRMIHPGDEFMVEFAHKEIERAKSASGVIFNT